MTRTIALLLAGMLLGWATSPTIAHATESYGGQLERIARAAENISRTHLKTSQRVASTLPCRYSRALATQSKNESSSDGRSRSAGITLGTRASFS